MTALEYHPLANLFPLIEGEEFEQLVASVRENGLRERIIIYEDKILDGRNRYRAAIAVGLIGADEDPWLRDAGGNKNSLKAPFSIFVPTRHGEPWRFVLDHNITRRHLTTSQRSLIAAELKRLGWGGDRSKTSNEVLTRDQRAEALKVSRANVERADNVVDHGAEELKEGVRQGKVSVSAAEAIAKLSVDEQRKIIALADPKAIKQAAKKVREEEQAKKKERRKAKEKVLGELQGPTGKFGLIVEDYEWDFEVWSRESGMDRHAANHYPVSEDAHTAEEIVKRTSDRFAVADDNCLLAMWTTVPHLAIAIDVLRQRGFRYVSHYIWGKDRIGTGHWNRNRHEVLLLGVKGHIPCPSPGDQWDSLIMAPVGAHSAKPECFMEMLEEYFPTLPKLELNARRQRKNWAAWGNEIGFLRAEEYRDSDNVITLPGSSSIPPDIGVGPDESEFDSPETKAALRASLSNPDVLQVGDYPAFVDREPDVDEIDVMADAMQTPAEDESDRSFYQRWSDIIKGRADKSNEAAESAEAGGPSREDGSAGMAPIPVSAASPRYRFTVVTWRGPPTEHMPEEPWARITAEAGTPDDVVAEKIAEVLAANPMIPAERVSVAIEIPSGASAGCADAAASDGGTHEDLAPKTPKETTEEIDRSEVVGMPQQPTASDSDDDMEIPPGLRVGDPANAWAKRGEGGS